MTCWYSTTWDVRKEWMACGSLATCSMCAGIFRSGVLGIRHCWAPCGGTGHSQLPNHGILKIDVAIFLSRQSVFPNEVWKLPQLNPKTSNTGKSLSSRSQYGKILQAHGANTRKYWLVEVIENDCIVTRVGVG